MPISTWGPPVWKFFHTLAEKVKDSEFDNIKLTLFMFIKQICKSLPCPTCSAHATDILQKINFESVKTKQDFKNVLFLFHNTVNKTKQKPLFNYTLLDSTYSDSDLIESYNNFISVYQTRGNFRLLAESFQRNLLINKLKSWIQQNIHYFERSVTNGETN